MRFTLGLLDQQTSSIPYNTTSTSCTSVLSDYSNTNRLQKSDDWHEKTPKNSANFPPPLNAIAEHGVLCTAMDAGKVYVRERRESGSQRFRAELDLPKRGPPLCNRWSVIFFNIMILIMNYINCMSYKIRPYERKSVSLAGYAAVEWPANAFTTL